MTEATTTVDEAAATEAAAATAAAGTPPPEAAATQEAPAPAPEFDWRKAIAGDDPKALKRLERFADLASYDKAFLDTQTAMRNAGTKVPGENATPEEIAAYHKAIGIPKSADEYKVKLPEGYEPSETDQASLKTIRDKLFAKGGHAASPETVQAAHDLYIEMQTDALAKFEADGLLAKEATEKSLRAAWGTDYPANIKFCEAALKFHAPKGFDTSEMMNLTLSDGTALGAYEPFVRLMAAIGRASVEDPTFALTNGFSGTAESMEARRNEIMAMRTSPNKADRDKYDQLAGPGGELGTLNRLLAASAKQRAA